MGRRVMKRCSDASKPRDVGGARCPSCDPVVQGTVYGAREDGFRFIRDTVVVRDGVRTVERIVEPWTPSPSVTVPGRLVGCA